MLKTMTETVTHGTAVPRDKASKAGPLSNWVIINYSAMYLPVSMALLPVGVYVQPYYAELGISLYAMSAIIFFSRISDVITDPLIGVLSDKTKSPWGRRKPWIALGTPLMMISIYMLFVPGENPSLGYFALWTILMYLAFTLVDLPYYAWGSELSTDSNHTARAVSLCRDSVRGCHTSARCNCHIRINRAVQHSQRVSRIVHR
jgi:Na+/melibiose symporter-like transporter